MKRFKSNWIIEGALSWIYPPRCLVCRDVLPLGGRENFACKSCREEMPYITGDTCPQCGRPQAGGRVCESCQGSPFAFRHGYAAFPYDSMKTAISKFKFEGYQKDGLGLSYFMWEYSLLYLPEVLEQYDSIIPVPIHKKKRRERGFNQTEVLAEGLSSYAGIAVNTKSLVRVRNTKPQNQLTANERKENVKGAFDVLYAEDIVGKSLLLLDDIFTTGSTINECARALLRSGANTIDFYALSIVLE